MNEKRGFEKSDAERNLSVHQEVKDQLSYCVETHRKDQADNFRLKQENLNLNVKLIKTEQRLKLELTLNKSFLLFQLFAGIGILSIAMMAGVFFKEGLISEAIIFTVFAFVSHVAVTLSAKMQQFVKQGSYND